MERVELFYKKLVEVTCLICKTDPVMMFSCNKESL